MAKPNPNTQLNFERATQPEQNGDANTPAPDDSLVNEKKDKESGDDDDEDDDDEDTRNPPEVNALPDKEVILKLQNQRTKLQFELKAAKQRASEAERKVRSLGKEARRLRMFDSLVAGFAAHGAFNQDKLDAKKLENLMTHIAGLAQVAEKRAADSGF